MLSERYTPAKKKNGKQATKMKENIKKKTNKRKHTKHNSASNQPWGRSSAKQKHRERAPFICLCVWLLLLDY